MKNIEKTNILDKNLTEDLHFAKKTEEAWKRIKEGKCKKMNFDIFLKNLKQTI